MDDVVWLVAGLGNPGEQYERTLHNLGFMTVDRLAERNGIRIVRPEDKALVGTGRISGARAVLAKPQTFMNLSGVSVEPLIARYGVDPARLILLYDDLDVSWTGVRIRPQGSAGGHHGMESVIKSIGSQHFPRVRLGIHPGHPVGKGADFVLSPLRRAQMEDLDELLDHAAAAVESIIADGVEKSMTKFNRRARGAKQEEE